MPPDPSPDALLVVRARQGDRTAWAELYERYADRLHDYAARLTGSRSEAGDCVQDAFVLAVQRIEQLRDPDKVRPWLYAIVRSTAHRHYRRVDRWAFGEVPDATAAGHGDDAVIAGLTAGEMAALVAEAAAGLTDDDRELLDLSLRHDLVPAEIAAALGVSSNHAAVTTERMRERLGRSITVTVLVRRPECADLAALAAKEGPLTPLSRKRLARHVDGCATCGAQAQRQVRPEALLAVAPLPLLLLPRRAFADFAPEVDAALEARHRGAPPADGGIEWGPDGFPLRDHPRRRRGWLVAAVVLGGLFAGAALVGGLGDGGRREAGPAAGATTATASTVVTTEGVPAGTDSVAPGTDGAPASSIDADPVGAGHGGDQGASGSEAPVPGGESSRQDPALPAVSTSVPAVPTASTSPPTTRPPSGSTTTTASTVPVSGSPTVPATTAATTASTSPPSSSAPPTTAPPTTTDTTGPALGGVTASVSDLTVVSSGSGVCKQPPTYTASYPTSVTVSVAASDPSGVTAVTFTWSSGSASGGGGMSPSGGGWAATVGPLDPSAAPLGGSTGEVTYPLSVTVTATDAGGHTSSTTRSGVVTVHNCYVIL